MKARFSTVELGLSYYYSDWAAFSFKLLDKPDDFPCCGACFRPCFGQVFYHDAVWYLDLIDVSRSDAVIEGVQVSPVPIGSATRLNVHR